MKRNVRIAAIAILWTAYAGIIGLLLWHSSLSGGESSEQSGGIAALLSPVFSHMIPDPTGAGRPIGEWWSGYDTFIRKAVGHFGGFFVCGGVGCAAFCLSVKRFALPGCLSVGLALGLLTEGIQLFQDGRNGSFSDVALDFAGYALAAGIVFVAFFLLRRHMAEKRE